MHKLIEYICDELEEIERKAEKEGKLSMTEIEYADKLAHMKKNLLKADEMMDEGEYSMDGGSYRGSSYRRGSSYEGGESGQSRRGSSYRMGSSRRGSSYARGRNARRDSMGRYSSAGEEMVEELRELMQDAPDEQTRQEFQRFIQKIESM